MEDAVEWAGRNCFVFRTSNHQFVQGELPQGRLRQGWSPPGTSLLNDEGNPRTRDAWAQTYIAAWGVKPSSKRHGILRRMLDMRIGDVVLCPKTPAPRTFTIADVSKCYRFEVSADQKDFGHIITVKNQRKVSNSHNLDSVAISDLFRSAYFRSPVTQVQPDKRQDVLEAAMRLLHKEDPSTPRDTQEIRQEMYHEGRKVAAQSLMGRVATWSFSQFEAAVGQAFQRKGYERLGGNITQKNEDHEINGDADHVFSIPMPGFEEMDSVSVPVLIVQVKHHRDGPTDVEGLRQLLNWEAGEDSGWEVRCRVLFSSTDSFTEKCRRLAEARDVTLICGIDAGLFML